MLFRVLFRYSKYDLMNSIMYKLITFIESISVLVADDEWLKEAVDRALAKHNRVCTRWKQAQAAYKVSNYDTSIDR